MFEQQFAIYLYWQSVHRTVSEKDKIHLYFQELRIQKMQTYIQSAFYTKPKQTFCAILDFPSAS